MAQWQIAETNVLQRLQPALQLRLTSKKREGFVGRQIEHLGYRHPAQLRVEQLALKSRAMTLRANDRQVREELHVDLDRTESSATRTASAVAGVEAEVPRCEVLDLRLGRLRE